MTNKQSQQPGGGRATTTETVGGAEGQTETAESLADLQAIADDMPVEGDGVKDKIVEALRRKGDEGQA